MTLRHLLFSREGRINRAKWWAATIPLLIVSNLLAGIAAGFTTMPRRELVVTLIFLNFWFAPAYAVAAKRFQDRDKPGQRALYGLVPYQIAVLAVVFHFVEPGPQLSGAGSTLGLVQLCVVLWFIIELGMLKGSSGPNRFGPNPLETVASGTRQDRQVASIDGSLQKATIGNRIFAYTVSAGGASVMLLVCNAIVEVVSAPGALALQFLIGTEERWHQPIASLVPIVTS